MKSRYKYIKLKVLISAFVMITSVLLLSMTSCGNAAGYPGKVTMNRNGDTIRVYGDGGYYGVGISNYDSSKRASSLPDSTTGGWVATLDWLTVISYDTELYMEMVADENTTGKVRVLYVDYMVQNSGGSIKVVQSK